MRPETGKTPVAGARHLRVVTYNVHKCRGMDGKTLPARIAGIVQSLDADIIGLQEMLDVRDGPAHFDQARHIAAALPGYAWRFGGNRALHGGDYGNMTLSRLPIESSRNLDLTHLRREARGCLRTTIRLSPHTSIQTYNLHLGTGFLERRHQVRMLLDLLEREPLDSDGGAAPRILLGDFNEWTRGLASRRLAAVFQTFDPASDLKRTRTYPGLAPVLHLDHLYFDPALHLENIQLLRNRETLIASDHLPLVAEFSLCDACL